MKNNLFLLVLTAATAAQAASITVEFKPAPGVTPDYDVVNIYLLADKACVYWDKAIKWQTRQKAFTKTFENLEEGEYYYQIFTGSYETRQEARPGAFCKGGRCELTNATSRATVSVEYQPLTNVSLFRGAGTRSGQVVDQDGQPVSDYTVRIATQFDGQKHMLYSFDRVRTGADGAFTFTNVNPTMTFVALDDDFGWLERLGTNRPVTIKKKRMVGRPAPELFFTDLANGRMRHLAEFAGK